MFTVAAAAPPSALIRLAGQSSAWIVLVDARDEDAASASRGDVEFAGSLGSVPMVVAAYEPVAGRGLRPERLSEVLGLDLDTPVVPCRLRDADSALDVLDAAVERSRVLDASLRASL